MRTTIGVTQLGRFSPRIEIIASEFFGVIAKRRNKRNDKILWLTFPSQKIADEFMDAIDLKCVDSNQKAFK